MKDKSLLILVSDIEKVISTLEKSSFEHGKQYTNKRTDNRQYHLGFETGLDEAINKLKELIPVEQIRIAEDDGGRNPIR